MAFGIYNRLSDAPENLARTREVEPPAINATVAETNFANLTTGKVRGSARALSTAHGLLMAVAIASHECCGMNMPSRRISVIDLGEFAARRIMHVAARLSRRRSTGTLAITGPQRRCALGPRGNGSNQLSSAP